jgi:hypothetical protein
MPQNGPDALRLRELKYSSKISEAERSRAGRALLELGRTTEAFDLMLLAGDEDGIKEVRRIAVKDGFPHLLLAMARYGRSATKEEWNASGDTAFAAGRLREAFRAYHEAGNEDGLGKVREQLGDYQPFKPQGK